MLYMTLSRGEKIKVADKIDINVVQCFKNQVRLGLDAPKYITIKRLTTTDIEATKQEKPKKSLK